MIQIDSIAMRFGERTLFEDISMNLAPACRYGITGANGSGKSTLLKILSDEITPHDGSVRIPGAVKVGFLKQNHFEYENERIIDTVLMGRPRLWAALKEKAQIMEADIHNAETGMRLAELEGVVGEEHGYNAESEAAVILEGLGIETLKHTDLLSSLSGGYKLRVLLAQCLFGEPGLLLLDEPTNHLDIVSIAWLETYLSNYAGTVVVVSHDHHFLNAVVTHILDIDYETVRIYHGNYDASLDAKALMRDQLEKEVVRQEKKKEELDAFVKRFRQQATKARQAMSRKKQLDKMDDIVIKRSSRVAPGFRFKQKRHSGRQVLELKNVSKAFGEVSVIEDLSLNVMRGERLAVVGPNGAGKTTLIRLIHGDIKPDSGEMKEGHEVSFGYFAQNHKEQISAGTTPYEWLLNHCGGATSSVVRSVLGSMLFPGDEATKKSEALSGGESARLIFSRLMLAEDNLLLLDEPTNHLDIESIEALASALASYPGTIIFVSHDRYFVELVATSVLELTPRAYDYFAGPYADFLAYKDVDHLQRGSSPVSLKTKNELQRNENKKKHKNKKNAPFIDIRALNKKISKLKSKEGKIERSIKGLEERREEINTELATGELYFDGREDELKERLEELKSTEASLETSFAEWEAVHDRVEEEESKLPTE